MPRFSTPVRTLLIVGLLSLGGLSRADEETVPLKDVPKAVLDSVKTRFPDAEIRKAEKETEDGKTTYELELKDKGADVDVTVTSEGEILEVEKTIAAKDLPKAVASAIEAKYPKSAIKKAEEIVEREDGKDVKCYEVGLETEAKTKRELTLSPEGKILEDEDDE